MSYVDRDLHQQLPCQRTGYHLFYQTALGLVCTYMY